MCGIFGMIADSGVEHDLARPIIDDLFRLSESRGKEASGLAIVAGDSIRVAKHAIRATDLVAQPVYRSALREAFAHAGNGHQNRKSAVAVIGHSRLVTNGAQQLHANNQPVVTSGVVGIHNGIITNVEALWERHANLGRRADIDTEVLLALLRMYHESEGDLTRATQKGFGEIEGGASIAVAFEDVNAVVLATNTGSLYVGASPDRGALLFASEAHIMESLARRRHVRRACGALELTQLEAGRGCLVDLDTLERHPFVLGPNGAPPAAVPRRVTRRTIDISPQETAGTGGHVPGQGPYILPAGFRDAFPHTRDAVSRLRRCSRCVLPETMPFIEFDRNGVCSYCRHYTKTETKGIDALRAAVEPYRRADGKPDCLVTFSGGRDSSYGLHYVVRELGLKPITYTYDWGMVTDLARRNQMRLCGKLGVEHILISADLAAKRANIRKNVTAWLARPVLGTVPLFMAGDKQYFYWANRVAERNGCQVIVLCENLLETTRFKTGFCGVAPNHGVASTYKLTATNKAQMAAFYAGQYLLNPRYINRSMLDTAFAFASYYFLPHDYLNLYGYIRWDEQQITDTLLAEYNWETAADTKSTWRIGDGTAAFYNYIYYTMAGLTENDTFRSNQIREGTLSREEALALVERDNEPRYDSIQWYCDIIGIDFADAIGRINAAPRLYPVE